MDARNNLRVVQRLEPALKSTPQQVPRMLSSQRHKIAVAVVAHSKLFKAEIIMANQWSDMQQELAGARACSQAPTAMYLDNCPRQFRQQLELSIEQHVLPTDEEERAASSSINDIVTLLQQADFGLDGQQVSVDRVEKAGSFGKKTCVQDDFDVDLVVFINLPAAYRSIISTVDPDSTQESLWMTGLRQQAYKTLQHGFPQGTKVSIKPTAIRCRLKTTHAGLFVDVDVVLAPNLAAAQQNSTDRAVLQRKAVLLPLLSAADAAAQGVNLNRIDLPKFSHARSIWLQETTTRYIRHAAIRSACKGGLSGRVVTSTIRLTKAWVRRGLQQTSGERQGYKRLKGIMIELLVLRAAQRMSSQFLYHNGAALALAQRQNVKTGRYVLDLFLMVLQEAQCWARKAAAAACGQQTKPVILEGLAAGQYYTKAQALWLQEVLYSRAPQDSWEAQGQPVVVHPVDPMENLFKQRKPFELWKLFESDAARVEHALRSQSWHFIRPTVAWLVP